METEIHVTQCNNGGADQTHSSTETEIEIQTEERPLDNQTVELISEISKGLVDADKYLEFQAIACQYNAHELTQLMQQEAFLIALLKFKLHMQQYSNIMEILQTAANATNPVFLQIWDEAVWRDKLKSSKIVPTPVNKCRIRKRYPPPAGLCVDGVRPMTRMSNEARSILQTWFKHHISSDPYPSRDTKQKLAITAGLTLKQVSMWLTNARRDRNKGKSELKKRRGQNPDSKTTKRAKQQHNETVKSDREGCPIMETYIDLTIDTGLDRPTDENNNIGFHGNGYLDNQLETMAPNTCIATSHIPASTMFGTEDLSIFEVGSKVYHNNELFTVSKVDTVPLELGISGLLATGVDSSRENGNAVSNLQSIGVDSSSETGNMVKNLQCINPVNGHLELENSARNLNSATGNREAQNASSSNGMDASNADSHKMSTELPGRERNSMWSEVVVGSPNSHGYDRAQCTKMIMQQTSPNFVTMYTLKPFTPSTISSQSESNDKLANKGDGNILRKLLHERQEKTQCKTDIRYQGNSSNLSNGPSPNSEQMSCVQQNYGPMSPYSNSSVSLQQPYYETRSPASCFTHNPLQPYEAMSPASSSNSPLQRSSKTPRSAFLTSNVGLQQRYYEEMSPASSASNSPLQRRSEIPLTPFLSNSVSRQQSSYGAMSSASDSGVELQQFYEEMSPVSNTSVPLHSPYETVSPPSNSSVSPQHCFYEAISPEPNNSTSPFQKSYETLLPISNCRVAQQSQSYEGMSPALTSSCNISLQSPYDAMLPATVTTAKANLEVAKRLGCSYSDVCPEPMDLTNRDGRELGFVGAANNNYTHKYNTGASTTNGTPNQGIWDHGSSTSQLGSHGNGTKSADNHGNGYIAGCYGDSNNSDMATRCYREDITYARCALWYEYNYDAIKKFNNSARNYGNNVHHSQNLKSENVFKQSSIMSAQANFEYSSASVTSTLEQEVYTSVNKRSLHNNYSGGRFTDISYGSHANLRATDVPIPDYHQYYPRQNVDCYKMNPFGPISCNGRHRLATDWSWPYIANAGPVMQETTGFSSHGSQTGTTRQDEYRYDHARGHYSNMVVQNAVPSSRVVQDAIATTLPQQMAQDSALLNHVAKNTVTAPLKHMVQDMVPPKPIAQDVAQLKPMTQDVPQLKPMTWNVAQLKPMTQDVAQLKPMTQDVAQLKHMTQDMPQLKHMNQDVAQLKPMTQDMPQLKRRTQDKVQPKQIARVSSVEISSPGKVSMVTSTVNQLCPHDQVTLPDNQTTAKVAAPFNNSQAGCSTVLGEAIEGLLNLRSNNSPQA